MERLAIIGGGASGLIAAHWLRRRIDVTVFEKRAELGGNVRTVNGNVSSPSVPSDLKLETGVLGFHKKSGPVLHALLEELGTAVRTGQPTASLYRQGHYYPSNFTDLMTPAIMMQLVKQPAYRRNMNALRSDYAASFRRFTRWDGASEEQVEALFGPNETVNDFIQSLLALAFSSTFDRAGSIPASFARQYLKTLRYPDWSYVEGGVYSYLDSIVRRGNFNVETDCGPVKLRRHDKGVTVQTKDATFEADAALLAVTPGQVLNVLDDADDTESALFAAWHDREISTTLHTDTRFYAPFGKSKKTPMDLFVDHNNTARGYNTALNQFCGLEGSTQYSFALGLDDVIRDESVLLKTDHTVPTYTVEAVETRDEIKALSGRRNTYFAGAWLYDGLHEGAVVSARMAVDHLLKVQVG